MSKPTESALRIAEIDALRGIAAIAVMLFHYTTRIAELYPMGEDAVFDFRHGHFGVNLFFIISGYVIFMTLHRTRQPMDFVVSRFSRLFPAYWFAVGLTFLVTYWLGLPGKEVTIAEAVANLIMIHGFFRIPHVDGVYWTLEVELLFYAGMFALYRLGWLKHIHLALWSLLAVRLAYHFAAILGGVELSWTVSRFLILAQIPWFAIGVGIYLLLHPRESADSNRSILLVAGSLLTLATTASIAIALLTGLMAIVVYAAAAQKLPWLGNSVMVWLGAISYTLYLLHENIGWSVLLRLRDWGVPRDLGIVLAIVLSLTLATLATKWVERPSMAWIRQQYKKRKRQ